MLAKMTPQQFTEHLAASPANATTRLLDLLSYLRHQGEDVFHALGGEDGVTKWGVAQYDKYIAPFDIPWLTDDQEATLVDDYAHKLIGFSAHELHIALHAGE